MRSMLLFALLLLMATFMMVVAVADRVPDRSIESEQRITSMETNQSVGNMTGDDYLIALIFAAIDDRLTLYKTHERGESFDHLQEEASSKYGEYRHIYYDNRFSNKLDNMMTMSAECDGGGYDCSSRHPVMPRQGFIDLLIYEIFHNDSELDVAYPYTGSTVGISDDIIKARIAYKNRITEEAELEAARKERETERLREQQETEARQKTLDAYYKGVFESYSINLADLLNQSKFEAALNLTNDTIGNLVTPYRNIAMIRKGDIYSQMERYDEAIESYKDARTYVKFSNESGFYQQEICQQLTKTWGPVIEIKIGIAQQKKEEQINAKINDLRDAPNVKQLLKGHDNGKKYTTNISNYTFLGYGYDVLVIVSAYNDIKSFNTTKYIEMNIPICIDIFAGLFNDKRISSVSIQINESYYDKFGHIKERPFMFAELNNTTAYEIGDWSDFKQYIGTDISKFRKVC